MHPIVADHPEWRAIEKDAEDLEKAHQKDLQRRLKADEDYREARAKWVAESDAALLRGREAAPEPVQRVVAGNPWLFQQELESLRATREALLAQLAPEVETAAAARELELRGEAAELIAALEPLARELSELASTVQLTRSAFGGGAGARINEAIDVGAVVDVLTRGGSFLGEREEQDVVIHRLEGLR